MRYVLARVRSRLERQMLLFRQLPLISVPPVRGVGGAEVSGGDVRLVLALGCKEVGNDSEAENDKEADDYTPAIPSQPSLPGVVEADVPTRWPWRKPTQQSRV